MNEQGMKFVLDADTTPLENAMKRAKTSMNGAASTMEREMQKVERSAKRMGLSAKELQKYTKGMQDVKKEYSELANSSDKFKGKNKEFMNALEKTGLKHKALTEGVTNNSARMRTAFLSSAGSMLAMSSQSDNIQKSFNGMKNPIHRVNNGLLKISSGLEGIAKRGNPAVLALKQLGPTASMKDLQKRVALIQGGLMRFPMVALVATGAVVGMFAVLGKAAMADPEYKKSWEKLGKTMKKAIEPMVEVFKIVTKPLIKFATKVGELIVNFNKAHPTLSKVIAAFLMLVPILTLILSPLAIGIGLTGGLSAAFAFLWGIIGPLIVGLAAMMGTVILVAAAIAGAAYLISKNWDLIKKSSIKLWGWISPYIMSAWESIKSGSMVVWEWILSFLKDTWEFIKKLAQIALKAVQEFWDKHGKKIIAILILSWSFISSFISSMWELIKTMVKMALDTITKFWDKHGKEIMAAVSFIWGVIKNSIIFVLGVILTVIKFVLTNIKKFWDKHGDEILSAIVKAWGWILGFITTVLDAVIKYVKIGIDAIKKFWDDHGEQIIAAVTKAWEWIKTTFMTAFNVVSTFVKEKLAEIKKFWDENGDQILQAVSNIWGFIKKVIIVAFKIIKSTITDALIVIKSLWDKYGDEIIGAIKWSWNLVSKIISAVWEGIKLVISGVLNVIMGIFKIFAGLFTGDWGKMWEGIKQVFGGIWDTIKGLLAIATAFMWNMIKAAWDLIKKYSLVLWDYLKEKFTEGKDYVIDKIKALGQFLMDKFKEIKADIIEKIKGMWDDAKTKFTNAKTDLVNTVIGFKDDVIVKFNEMKDGVVGKFKDMWTAVKKGALDWWETFKGFVHKIPGAMGNAIADKAGDAVAGVIKLADTIKNKFKELFSIDSPSKWFNEMGGWMIKGLVKGLGKKGAIEKMRDLAKSIKDEARKASGYANVDFKGGAGVEQWRGTAKKALEMTGDYSEANLNALMRRMNQESGGNPNIFNNWDSNAKKGTPSGGLMQTIKPTFDAYAQPGYDKNMLDPLSNILASINYTKARYGSLQKGWNRAGGYATGGVFKGSNGGSLINIAENGGDEAVLPLSNKSRMKPFAAAVASMMPERQVEQGQYGIKDLYITNVVELDGEVISQKTIKKTQIMLEQLTRRQERLTGKNN